MLLALAALGIAAVGVSIAVWWQTRKVAEINATLSPLAYGIRWCPGDAIEGDVLRAHLDFALKAIAYHVAGVTLLTAQQAVSDIIIRVRNTDKWLSSTQGCNVAGETTFVGYTQVTVGLGLEALCHELCHVLEVHMGRECDYGHIGWTANGMAAAIDEYLNTI